MLYKRDQADQLVNSGGRNVRVGNIPILNCVGSFSEQAVDKNGCLLRDFVGFNGCVQHMEKTS